MNDKGFVFLEHLGEGERWHNLALPIDAKGWKLADGPNSIRTIEGYIPIRPPKACMAAAMLAKQKWPEQRAAVGERELQNSTPMRVKAEASAINSAFQPSRHAVIPDLSSQIL